MNNFVGAQNMERVISSDDFGFVNKIIWGIGELFKDFVILGILKFMGIFQWLKILDLGLSFLSL